MKLAIMQPYFFPYIGYFQLVKAVDTFVVYDDVNYIKQGWINRNRILMNGKDHMINLILSGASSFKLINEVEVTDNSKLLKTIQQAYGKAPYYNDCIEVISECLTYNTSNLALFLKNSLENICRYLSIKTDILLSSDLSIGTELKAQDRIIAMCTEMGAQTYVNAIGGQELYDKDSFNEAGINLLFIKSTLSEYKQFKNDFVPGLSIIDILMFNSPETINTMLDNYNLI